MLICLLHKDRGKYLEPEVGQIYNSAHKSLTTLMMYVKFHHGTKLKNPLTIL